MPDEKILSEIDAQKTLQDPFAVAKNRASSETTLSQSKVNYDGINSMFSFGPFMQQDKFNPAQGPQDPNKQSSQSFQSLFQQPDSGNTMDSRLMDSIKKMDVDNKNIPMSPIGKMVLMNRLNEKYGPKYMDQKGVKDLLGNFDKALSWYSDESASSMVETLNKSQRTLAALRGR